VDVVFLDEGVRRYIIKQKRVALYAAQDLPRSLRPHAPKGCQLRRGQEGNFLTAYFAKLFTRGILLLLGRVGGKFIRMSF